MPAKILVVDDSAMMRRVITDTLKIGGYDVDSASDGEEALEKLGVERFDLAIVDLIMPKMDGFQLMQAIKERPSKDRPIIIIFTLTTVTDEDYKKRAFELGAKVYMVKPFRAKELLSTVEKYMREKDEK